MSTGLRRRGREFALKIIYSGQNQTAPLRVVLDDFWKNFRFNEDILGDPQDDMAEPIPLEVRRFAEDLASKTLENLPRIDGVIGEFSTNWSLERMARVDLSLLRMATCELLFLPEVPGNVAINEAIEIGKRYGTKETPAFVNGILDKISRNYRPNGQ
jgi:N utilization substance protein B